jgi:probable lipoprotein NlpC
MELFLKLKSKQKVLFLMLFMMLHLFTSCASHRKRKQEDERINSIIREARSYIGTPYKYGGTTRAGMDCSGLLINSFRVAEITLPRSSADQSRIGQPVEMEDLQPGDLVFFATGKKKKVITHVGMVTECNGKRDVKFIHSSSSVGVVETNLYADYYQQRYRGARRVINE